MAAINAVTDLTREGDIAVLTINSPPVNALSADVRNGLRDGAQQAAADPAVKAIVLICAGPHLYRRRRHLRVRQAVARARRFPKSRTRSKAAPSR